MGESLQRERESPWASRLAAPGSPKMVPRPLHFTSVTPLWTVLGNVDRHVNACDQVVSHQRDSRSVSSYQAQMIRIKILSKMDNCAKFLRAVGALCEAF